MRILRPWFAVSLSRATLALGLLATAAPTLAASLQVSPVTLSFQPGQPAQGLTLRNTGDAPLTGQVRVFAWSQDGQDDKLDPAQNPTQTLVASPPMVNIPPQGEQLVRVVRTGHPPLDHELTYRLLIDELPSPQAAANSPAEAGINFRLRYSIPVFVPLPGPAAPQLSWSLRQHDGGWYLAVSNQGGAHAQLSAVRLAGAGGQDFELVAGLLGYALAGSGREWRLPERFPPALAAAGLRVQATVNGSAAAPAAVDVVAAH